MANKVNPACVSSVSSVNIEPTKIMKKATYTKVIFFFCSIKG